MQFLKRLFGGGQPSDDGLYFYVRPRGCEEVVRVRIDPSSELSLQEGGGYFAVKTVRGTHRCFNPAEMHLYFDKSRNLTNSEVSGGEMVDEAAYNAYIEAHEAKQQAIREQKRGRGRGRGDWRRGRG